MHLLAGRERLDVDVAVEGAEKKRAIVRKDYFIGLRDEKESNQLL